METKASNREEEANENIRYSKERTLLEKCIPTLLLCKAQVFFEAQRLPNCVFYILSSNLMLALSLCGRSPVSQLFPQSTGQWGEEWDYGRWDECAYAFTASQHSFPSFKNRLDKLKHTHSQHSHPSRPQSLAVIFSVGIDHPHVEEGSTSSFLGQLQFPHTIIPACSPSASWTPTLKVT